ncbi:MAG: hypothetical protein AAB429_03490 [Patescibacteria group bacterium]|mgnify:CR=1 FL=1
MIIILVLGIILIALPIIGFAICGSIMLYQCLMEDAPEGLFGAIMASFGVGLVLLIIYFGLTFSQQVK